MDDGSGNSSPEIIHKVQRSQDSGAIMDWASDIGSPVRKPSDFGNFSNGSVGRFVTVVTVEEEQRKVETVDRFVTVVPIGEPDVTEAVNGGILVNIINNTTWSGEAENVSYLGRKEDGCCGSSVKSYSGSEGSGSSSGRGTSDTQDPLDHRQADCEESAHEDDRRSDSSAVQATETHCPDQNGSRRNSEDATTLDIKSTSQTPQKRTTAPSNVIDEEVVVYRLPGERIGLGLKFDGGVKRCERVKHLFVQSCAPKSPASRARCTWGMLGEGDEIVEIEGMPVSEMTRVDCVACLKEASVAVRLKVRHFIASDSDDEDEEEDEDVEYEERIDLKITEGTPKKVLPQVVDEIIKKPSPPPIPPRKNNKKPPHPSPKPSDMEVLPPAAGFGDGDSTPVPLPRRTPPSVHNTTDEMTRRPPEPDVYLNLLQGEEETKALYESDDTGSTVSTVRMSRSFSDASRVSSLAEETRQRSRFDLARVLSPFEQLEREFQSDEFLLSKFLAESSPDRDMLPSIDSAANQQAVITAVDPPESFQDSTGQLESLHDKSASLLPEPQDDEVFIEEKHTHVDTNKDDASDSKKTQENEKNSDTKETLRTSDSHSEKDKLNEEFKHYPSVNPPDNTQDKTNTENVETDDTDIIALSLRATESSKTILKHTDVEKLAEKEVEDINNKITETETDMEHSKKQTLLIPESNEVRDGEQPLGSSDFYKTPENIDKIQIIENYITDKEDVCQIEQREQVDLQETSVSSTEETQESSSYVAPADILEKQLCENILLDVNSSETHGTFTESPDGNEVMEENIKSTEVPEIKETPEEKLSVRDSSLPKPENLENHDSSMSKSQNNLKQISTVNFQKIVDNPKTHLEPLDTEGDNGFRISSWDSVESVEISGSQKSSRDTSLESFRDSASSPVDPLCKNRTKRSKIPVFSVPKSDAASTRLKKSGPSPPPRKPNIVRTASQNRLNRREQELRNKREQELRNKREQEPRNKREQELRNKREQEQRNRREQELRNKREAEQRNKREQDLRNKRDQEARNKREQEQRKKKEQEQLNRLEQEKRKKRELEQRNRRESEQRNKDVPRPSRLPQKNVAPSKRAAATRTKAKPKEAQSAGVIRDAASTEAVNMVMGSSESLSSDGGGPPPPLPDNPPPVFVPPSSELLKTLATAMIDVGEGANGEKHSDISPETISTSDKQPPSHGTSGCGLPKRPQGTKMHSLFHPKFSEDRLPPDGHEFPPNYTDADDSGFGSPSPRRPSGVVSRLGRKDEKSGKSVKDKIAMFSKEQELTRSFTHDDVRFDRSKIPVRGSNLSRSSDRLKDESTSSTPAKDAESVSLQQSRSQSMVDVTSRKFSSLSAMVEQRRRSLSKLRGLVIPEHRSSLKSISDLPEIISKDSAVTTGLKDSPQQRSHSVAGTATFNRTSKDKAESTRRASASVLSSPPWKSPGYSTLPKYSPAFKKKSLTVYNSTPISSTLPRKSTKKPSNFRETSPLKSPSPPAVSPPPSSEPKSMDSVASPKSDSSSSNFEFTSHQQCNGLRTSEENRHVVSSSTVSRVFVGSKNRDVQSKEGCDSDNDSLLSSGRSSMSQSSPCTSPTPQFDGRVLKADSVEAHNRRNVLESARFSSGGRSDASPNLEEQRKVSIERKLSQESMTSSTFSSKESRRSSRDSAATIRNDSFDNGSFFESSQKTAYINILTEDPPTSGETNTVNTDALSKSASTSRLRMDAVVSDKRWEELEKKYRPGAARRPTDLPVTRRFSPPTTAASSTSHHNFREIAEKWQQISVEAPSVPVPQGPITSPLTRQDSKSELKYRSATVMEMKRESIDGFFSRTEMFTGEVRSRTNSFMDGDDKEVKFLTGGSNLSDGQLGSSRESILDSVDSLSGGGGHRSASVTDLRRAFEKAGMALNTARSHGRMSSLDSTTSEESGSLVNLSSFPRDQYGSITSLASSTSLISTQELQCLIDDANQSLEESGTPSHEILVVVLMKEYASGSIGITLAGGADYETKEITVHKVISGSLADRDGRVQKGDRVLSINGKNVKGLTHKEALGILKAPRPEVVLVLSRSRSVTPQECEDPLYRITSPINVTSARPPRILESPLDSKSLLSDLTFTDVPRSPPTMTTLKKDGAGLGFSLEGGKDSPLGDRPLTIKKIFTGGAADKNSTLKVGDEIVGVNNTDVTSMSRIEAWNYMKKLPDGIVNLLVRVKL